MTVGVCASIGFGFEMSGLLSFLWMIGGELARWVCWGLDNFDCVRCGEARILTLEVEETTSGVCILSGLLESAICRGIDSTYSVEFLSTGLRYAVGNPSSGSVSGVCGMVFALCMVQEKGVPPGLVDLEWVSTGGGGLQGI